MSAGEGADPRRLGAPADAPDGPPRAGFGLPDDAPRQLPHPHPGPPTAAARRPSDRRGSRPGLGPSEELRQPLLPGRRQDRVDGVVDGHDPDEPPLVVDDRHGEEVVAGDDRRHVVLVVEDPDRDRIADHDLADRGVGLGDDEVAEGEDADEVPLVVGDVDVVDRLGVRLELPESVDGLSRGQVVGDGDELGRHDPAGGVLRVAEELPDLVGLVALHEGEDLGPGLIRQVGDEVGGVIGAHLFEDVGGALGREVLEDLDLGLGRHLLDGLGRDLVVEGGHDPGPVLRGELVDDRRQVGRVQLAEAGMGHPELDRGDGGLDGVDVLPIDVALRNGEAEVPGDEPVGALDAESTEEAGGADVDGDEMEPPLDLVEPEVVDADDLPTVDVDDLLVHEVGAEEDLVRPLAELADVDGPGGEACAGRVEGRDRRPGHEDLPATGLHDEAGDGRVGRPDGHDEVVDGPDRFAIAVADGAPDGLGEVEHGPPRRRSVPSAGGRRSDRDADRRRGPPEGKTDRIRLRPALAGGTRSGLHLGGFLRCWFRRRHGPGRAEARRAARGAWGPNGQSFDGGARPRAVADGSVVRGRRSVNGSRRAAGRRQHLTWGPGASGGRGATRRPGRRSPRTPNRAWRADGGGRFGGSGARGTPDDWCWCPRPRRFGPLVFPEHVARIATRGGQRAGRRAVGGVGRQATLGGSGRGRRATRQAPGSGTWYLGAGNHRPAVPTAPLVGTSGGASAHRLGVRISRNP
ncbi:MAG: hypothetical protein KatS3mg065_0280 [Chloroflexota bacterium]|nr:MAG: hypothetical protein KatS3mg065_0280 [Chloroflexota bacterium]